MAEMLEPLELLKADFTDAAPPMMFWMAAMVLARNAVEPVMWMTVSACAEKAVKAATVVARMVFFI